MKNRSREVLLQVLSANAFHTAVCRTCVNYPQGCFHDACSSDSDAGREAADDVTGHVSGPRHLPAVNNQLGLDKLFQLSAHLFSHLRELD